MLCRGGLGGPDVLMQDRGSADADATVDGPDSGPVAVIGQQDSKQQSRFVAVLFCICTKQQQRALHMDTENRESLSQVNDRLNWRRSVQRMGNPLHYFPRNKFIGELQTQILIRSVS